MAELVAPKWSGPTLYRRLLKLYISKFNTDVPTIIRAAKQTKFEFYFHRGCSVEDAVALRRRGELVHQAIQGGVIPIYSDAKTGKMFCKYDQATLAASGGHVDPMDAETFVRRYHDKIPKEDLEAIQQNLVKAGRWAGEIEFRAEDTLTAQMKKKRKPRVKCTDPEEEEPTAAATAAGDASAPAAPTTAA